MKLRHLLAEARGIATLHNHQLGVWLKYPHRGEGERVAYCTLCGESVVVDLETKDATGGALEVSCTKWEPSPFVVAERFGLVPRGEAHPRPDSWGISIRWF